MSEPTDKVEGTAGESTDDARSEQAGPRKPTVDELAYGSYLMVYDLYAFMNLTRQQVTMANARMTGLENRIDELTGRLHQAEQQVGQITTKTGENDGG